MSCFDIFRKKHVTIIIAFLFIIATVSPVSALKVVPHEIIEKVHDRAAEKNAEYDMIIIAPSRYQPAIEPLKDHKNKYNITTKIVTLDDIYGGKYFEPQGRDDQEKIKYFIKNAKENWNITYVLLVGGFRQIPVRYCYNDDNYSDYPEPRFISDLYYADIFDENGNFSNWDTDNDGVYGEWNDTEAEDRNINLTPDICLGRLACRNKLEVKIMTQKIINYEKKRADPSWFKKMVVVGGDTYSNATEHYGEEYYGFEGEINTQKALDIMSDFNPVKLWASTDGLDTYGLNIIKAINNGCGFLYFSGHGSPAVWATYLPNTKTTVGILTLFHMPFLINFHMLPVCIVEGCHNSQIDVTPLNIIKGLLEEGTLYFSKSGSFWRYDWVPECWSWWLTRKLFGGSIATIGCTGLGWQGIEYGGGGIDWLSLQFFREYANGTEFIGEIWKKTLTSYLKNFPINWSTPAGGTSSINAKTVQEWILLGDPSLKIGGYPVTTPRNSLSSNYFTS